MPSENHTNASPLERAGAGSCVTDEGTILIFCGKGEKNSLYGDCWSCTGKEKSLRLESEAPKEFEPRAHASVTIVGRCVWIIGGIADGYIAQDVWCYNIDTKEWFTPALKCVDEVVVGCTLPSLFWHVPQ